MSKRLPQATKSHLEKCRAAAIAAVTAYNCPGPQFRTAVYVVLIVIAWQAYFHACFYKWKRKPWYVSKPSKSKTGIRYKKVDGEPKHWDLSTCLTEYFKDKHPAERYNLKYLIGLRNRIEHQDLPELDLKLYPECQSALMNLEDYLVKEFGTQYALCESLAISLQFSRTNLEEKKSAFKKLARGEKSVLDYIERFRGDLPDHILNDIGYSFQVFLVPKVAKQKKVADAALEFVHMKTTNKEELERLTALNVLIKDKHIPIANLNFMKPGVVVKKVRADLPFAFNQHHHMKAWKYFRVRPGSKSKKPENTDQSFCIYDKVHQDYLYNQAWVDKLIRELSKPDKFQEVTSQVPRPVILK